MPSTASPAAPIRSGKTAAATIAAFPRRSRSSLRMSDIVFPLVAAGCRRAVMVVLHAARFRIRIDMDRRSGVLRRIDERWMLLHRLNLRFHFLDVPRAFDVLRTLGVRDAFECAGCEQA